MAGSTELKGPDLKQGVPRTDLKEGSPLLGHADGEAVLLLRTKEETFAVGATCTHYGGPLADGLVDGQTIHCPWHHACFDLKTGEALQAPALNPVACYGVEERGDKLYVLSKKPESKPKREGRGEPVGAPSSIVIVGGGAAGHAAAEMLRRQEYDGAITILSADDAPPVDRPNLSKDYLAGTAPEEWIPLRPPEFYAERGIALRTAATVGEIDVAHKRVTEKSGKAHPFDALLLATGADPVRLAIPGSDLPHVHTLRALKDSRAIIAKASTAKRAVVLGASFIGLEVAGALRTRNIEVHVVAPEKSVFERVLGPELGHAIRALHEEHGVTFHLEQTAKSIDPHSVTLANGDVLPADLVVVGIGVRPALGLAEKAGVAIDRGVLVDEYLETSAPHIYAAGDIARWPDPHTGSKIRVEHWVVAQRQGQIAARNMLGQKVRCDLVPFFWSQHYDMQINYVGHAESWDRVDVKGSIAKRDCSIAYRVGGKIVAVVTIGRDLEGLRAERALFQNDPGTLAALLS
jgi:NADPH-dependent 2,4-dienoyl-CoA reductase/sulfur reductase-like enzyme/nitrite reductase/ring-hydroxylating ferredoxin subunit